MRSRSLALASFVLLGLSIVLGGVAAATTITDSGVTYTLYNPVLTGSDGVTDTYSILLDIDASGYTGDSTDVISSVSLKLASASALDGVDLLAGTTYDYTLITMQGTSSSGCSGPSNGYGCATGTSTVGSDYLLLWEFTVDSGTTLINPASLKVVFEDANGVFVSQLSEKIVAPEPGTFGLVGLALLGIAGTVLWKGRQAPGYTV